MLVALLFASALAAPDADFLRVGETTRVARYNRVDGRPARARQKNAKGAYEAWVFRDGKVEHYRKWDGRTLVEEGHYDAVADPWVTVRYVAGAPAEATVHGRASKVVPIAAWNPAPYGAAVLTLPPVTHHGDGTLRAELPDGGLWRADWLPTGDPFGEPFQISLAARCGCDVVDRYTVFADGRAGAGVLVLVPGLDTPRLGEVMAFPDPSGVFAVAYTAPTGTDAVGVDDPAVRLAPGRAIVALLRWETPR